MLKNHFKARSVLVWTEESIKGHFVICYLALVIQRLLEYLLHTKGMDYSTERIQDAIRSATITKVHLDGKEIFIKYQSDEAFSEIPKALGLEDIPAYGVKEKRTKTYLHTKK